MNTLTRRGFLGVAAAGAVATGLAGCGSPAVVVVGPVVVVAG